jgi:capsid protein
MGRLKLSGFFNDPLAQQAWLGANFYGASMPEIDPEKAVRASTLRINEALSTRERESMELTGLNFDEIVTKREDEETQMNKVREISNKTDVKYGKQVNNNGGDNAKED